MQLYPRTHPTTHSPGRRELPVSYALDSGLHVVLKRILALDRPQIFPSPPRCELYSPTGSALRLAAVPGRIQSTVSEGGTSNEPAAPGHRLIADVDRSPPRRAASSVLHGDRRSRSAARSAVGRGPRDEDGEYIKHGSGGGAAQDHLLQDGCRPRPVRDQARADEILILRESDVLAKVVGDRAGV